MGKWKSRLGKLAVVGLLAMVMACMCAAFAWAGDEGDDSGYNPDAVIMVVEWNEDGEDRQVTVTEEMFTAAGFSIQASRQGCLYEDKNKQWHVVGTDRWVYFDDVLKAAGATVTQDTKLTLWVYNDDQPETPVEYTKYYPRYYEIDGRYEPLYFYPDTTVNTFVPLNPVDFYTCIALNCGSAKIGESECASDTLASLTMSTSRAPRLLWGIYDPLAEEVGGNRFPSNIYKLVLTEENSSETIK